MDAKRLLHERPAALYVGLSVATLRRRRRNKDFPSWVRLGRRIAYRIEDLDAFIEMNRIIPTKPQGGAR
jgi:predicted DNA-binding transcriptional regulator AlpA